MLEGASPHQTGLRVLRLCRAESVVLARPHQYTHYNTRALGTSARD
jgi:hypothetical protein